MIKKILIITPTPTHPQDAGNRARIHRFVNALLQMGHDVHVAFVKREAGDVPSMEAFLGHRFHAIKLVPIFATRILDVGCGAGVLGKSIKWRQAAEVHGVELAIGAAGNAGDHLDRVWDRPIESVLPELSDDYYDCIIAADVLEHLNHPWETLKSPSAKLAPNGKMVISLPNVQNWGVVFDLLEGKWDYRSEGILDRTHLHFFTRKSVEELFWNAGLRISHIGTTTRGPSLPNNFTKSLRKLGMETETLEQDAEPF